MTAIIITASPETTWVRPLGVLRNRGIGVVVVSLEAGAFAPAADAPGVEHQLQRSRALRHALAEYELPAVRIGPHQALAEALAR